MGAFWRWEDRCQQRQILFISFYNCYTVCIFVTNSLNLLKFVSFDLLILFFTFVIYVCMQGDIYGKVGSPESDEILFVFGTVAKFSSDLSLLSGYFLISLLKLKTFALLPSVSRVRAFAIAYQLRKGLYKRYLKFKWLWVFSRNWFVVPWSLFTQPFVCVCEKLLITFYENILLH